MMKAFQVSKADASATPEMKFTEVPKPSVKPGYVLVQIKASAIQPSDRLNVKGGFGKTEFPRVPGRDFSGIIVDGLKERIGEEVFGTGGSLLGFKLDGAHAEFCLMPENLAIPKPKSLSFVQAAQVGVPFQTAMLTLTKARASSNDCVLVLGGDGMVGSSARQIAGILGCKRIIGASRHGSGPDHVNTVDDPQLETIAKLTDGHGIDVVVDTVGDLGLMNAAIDKLAPRGRYAFISAPRGGASTVLPLDVLKAYRNQMELIGCDSASQSPEDMAPELEKLRGWFASGDLKAKAESDLEIYSLDKIAEAYASPSKKPAVIVISSS